VDSKVYGAHVVRTITELANELGLASDTLRYYERSGLIASAGRTPAGYRLYEAATADRVRFIKGAQRSGLRLREIAELLTILDAGNCPCGHTAVIVEQRISEVDAELAHLAALRDALVRLRRASASCTSPSADRWRCQLADSQEGGDAS
jgi:MerR family copper efflux transcriptional regulator